MRPTVGTILSDRGAACHRARSRTIASPNSEILTESFCERCGTRYTFEAGPAKRRRPGLKGVRVLSRGIKNWVMEDGQPLDAAMAEARREEGRDLAAAQMEAFHQTFNFCMDCRQYACTSCWNPTEGRCLTCAPLPEDADQAAAVAAFGTFAAGTNGTHLEVLEAWPSADLGVEAEETVDLAQPLAAVSPEPVASTAPARAYVPTDLTPLDLPDDEEVAVPGEVASLAIARVAEDAATPPPAEDAASDVAVAEPALHEAVAEPAPEAVEPTAPADRVDDRPVEPIAAEAPPAPPAGPAAPAPPAPQAAPGWTIVAPDEPSAAAAPAWPPQTPVYQPPAPRKPVPGQPSQPSTPAWPTHAPAAFSGPAMPAPASVWEESSLGVIARPGSGVQACVSCGLPLSATARFCRRCGSRQG